MQDVLFVTVDSLRGDHVGRYGYDRNTTPVIDGIAAGGHRFTNAFAHACATRASFPSILTSTTALMYGGYERVSDQQTLVTEALPSEYHTAGFHSNLYLSAEFGYDRGFDTFFDSKTDPSGLARLKQVVKERLDEDGRLYELLSGAVDTAEKEAGINIGSAYIRADEITDRAIEWAERQRDGPQFCWTHYMDVHHPYLPPERHQRALGFDPIGEREAVQLRRTMIEEPESLTADERESLIELYDAEIRFTDTEIGRLVKRVRSQWGEDTIVIVTADHGEAFGKHDDFGHTQTFHDEMTHVPLVIDLGKTDDTQTQGAADEAVHDEIVGLADVTPTIVDYAGGEGAESFTGHSLRPLLSGDEWPREYVVGDWSEDNQGGGERRYAYRNHRWKYIEIDGAGTLYDLDADPGETTDVATENPDVCDRIQEVLDEHRRAIEATADDLESVEMDEATKQRLRDLGYAE